MWKWHLERLRNSEGTVKEQFGSERRSKSWDLVMDVPGQEEHWLVPSFGSCGAVGAVLRLDLGYALSLLDSAVPHKELDFALKGFVSLFSRGTRRGRCGSTISAPGPTTACPATPAASWISWRRCTTSRRAFLMQGLSWSTAGESMGWAPPATPPFGLDS